MKTVNIATLKNQLSAYLRLVRDGEEVVVKDRDKPVARILPIRTPATLEEEEAQLVATGLMRLPQEEVNWEAFWALPMPAVSDEAAREAILWAKGYKK